MAKSNESIYIVANPHGHPEGVRLIALGEGDEAREFFEADTFDAALVSAPILAEFIAEGVLIAQGEAVPLVEA